MPAMMIPDKSVGAKKAVSPKVPKKTGKQSYTVPSNYNSPTIGDRGGYSVADKTTGQPFTPERLAEVTASGYVSPGNYSGGGGGGGGVVPMVAAPTDEDYLAGDAGYQTQLSALQGALQRFLADSDFQRTNYTTDYNRSLRDLGYDEGTKAWNWDDRLTASGRGYNNQLDDFASRGMLQSQGYADAFSELQRMLGQQYDALSGAKTNFMTDLDNQIANFRGENTSNQQAARAEALQRRAAQYAL